MSLSQGMFRFDDPIESRLAAGEIATERANLRLESLGAAISIGGPATALEIATHAAKRCEGRVAVESYRKRIHELVNAGELECVGSRRCQISGKTARTFRAKGK